jgi:chromate transport protein ChrA
VSRRAQAALAADVVCVLLFVAIGRRSHDEGGNVIAGALRVAAPFLLALGFGWLALRVWRQPLAWRTGVALWVGTVVIGMVMRRFAFERGIATSFIVVATVALGVLLNGWRAIARARQ